MKHIITLSGHSQRFLDEGYTIKPLIKICNKTVIEYVTEMLGLTTFGNVVFIIKKEDIISHNLYKFLKTTFPGCIIQVIDSHKLGPVHSILQAECLNDEEETLITYCDLYIKWNIQEFFNFLKSTNSDGCIVSHAGWHPHRIYNNYFAYLRVNGDSVLEIKEKKHFTNDPVSEYASGGIYYFKTGKMAKHYFQKLVQNNITVNGEFYVTLPFNLMIQDGLNVTHFDSKNYVCLGTPKDVEIFSACSLLNKNLKQNEDIINTINYFNNLL